MGIFRKLQQHRPIRSTAAGTTAILVGLVLFTLVYGPVPRAVAASGVYVRTESGITRCVIKPDEVACEAGGDTQTHTGFLQAPMVTDMSFHWDLAIVTTAGNFRWADGNIGTAYPNGDMVLNYGTTYHFNGWTVEGSSDGTRFTNDGTGHGMFVSIQNVFSF